MKKNIFLIFVIFCLIGAAGLANKAFGLDTSAQSAGTLLSRITFPIIELGNCADATACKTFCEQTQNHDACYKFAMTHQLIHPPAPTQPTKEHFLSDAKSFLGCDSYDSCKAFCINPDNHTKCAEFSQAENKLYANNGTNPTPRVTSLTALLFQAAKTELGCDNESTCQALCAKTENATRCLAFAYHHQLLLGNKPSTPPTEINRQYPPIGIGTPSGTLPCNSVESCYKLCSTIAGCPGAVSSYLKKNNINIPPPLPVTPNGNYTYPAPSTNQ